jgi:hypothetical protein
MARNMRLKVKYNDFIQLETYQNLLSIFLMKGAFIGCKGVYEKQEHPIIFMNQKITAKPTVQVAPINSPFTLDFIVYIELYSGT